MSKKITLKINGTSPNKISLERLSDYLKVLSDLYGAKEHVSFQSVEKGSAELVSLVDDNSYPKVSNRLRDAHSGVGAKGALKAYKQINQMISEDGTGGEVRVESAKIIQFDSHRVSSENLIHMSQPGEIQGKLYSIGGKDNTVPVRLESANGNSYMCEASVEVAKEMASLLFSYVRLTGKGTWERRQDGVWHLKMFYISSFEKLKDDGVKDTLNTLRNINKLGWDKMDNPHDSILSARH